MKLGRFTQDKDGNFHGTMKAFGIPEASIMLSPTVSQEGKPYYEVIGDPVSGAFDGGAAFPKQKGNLEYLSVSMDSPAFPAPINAGLFQDKTNPAVFNLVWDRPIAKPTLTAEATATGQAPANAQPQKRSFFNKNPAMNL